MFSSSDDSEASEPERRHLDPSEESEGEDLNDHFVEYISVRLHKLCLLHMDARDL